MNNTMPKYDWNLNCVAYGANILIKLDSVDLLRTQFEKFESHFRNDEHVIYDVKIPLFVVEAFSKLWKLWLEFPELHDVIKRSSFYEVFKEMSSFFGAQDEQSSGESVVKTNEPVHRAEVEQSRQPAATHYLLVDEFRGCGARPLGPKKPFAVPYLNSLDYLNNKSPTAFVHLSSDPQTNPQLKMDPPASGSSSRSPEDTKNTQQCAMLRSSTPNPNSYATPAARVKNETNIFLKLPTQEDPHCGPCCRSIAVSNGESIEEHLQSLKHNKQVRLMKDGVFYLEQNKHVIILQCERTMRFLCTVCQIVQEGTNCLIQHCRSKAHSSKMKEPSLTKLPFSIPSAAPAGSY